MSLNAVLTQASPVTRSLIQRSFSTIKETFFNSLKVDSKMATQQESLARALWRSADAVCFDVDSTVCRDEAIDELAKFANKEKEVSEM